MGVVFGDDATYIVTGVGSISFQIFSSDVLEFNDVPIVISFKSNILLVSCMTILQWRVSFQGKQCTINENKLASPMNLARELR
jgi:hypothetical protein